MARILPTAIHSYTWFKVTLDPVWAQRMRQAAATVTAPVGAAGEKNRPHPSRALFPRPLSFAVDRIVLVPWSLRLCVCVLAISGWFLFRHRSGSVVVSFARCRRSDVLSFPRKRESTPLN